MLIRIIPLAVLAAMLTPTVFAAAPSSDPQVEVRTSDVDLFYRLYDAAGGVPTAEVLQRDYIDGGSEGVRQFVPNRIRSGEELARVIAANRDVYDNARTCQPALPVVRDRLRQVFTRLAKIDPESIFPPVVILIGRNNSGGTTGHSGVLIGLEVICRAIWLQPKPADRLLHLIAHEYGHVQQFPHGGEEATPNTVLRQSLVEGEAELIAELTSGEASESHLQRWTRGREREIESAFLADMDSADLKPWLYNGVGTPEKPGDLGYWVGYRIAKAYYTRARDKRAAMNTLLDLKDPKQILVDSGWRPGGKD